MRRRRETAADTAAAFQAAYARRNARRRLTPAERAERLRLEAERAARVAARDAARRERQLHRLANLNWWAWLKTPPGRQLRRFAQNLLAALALHLTEDPRWRERWSVPDSQRRAA